jgi:hypothetical protein
MLGALSIVGLLACMYFVASVSVAAFVRALYRHASSPLSNDPPPAPAPLQVVCHIYNVIFLLTCTFTFNIKPSFLYYHISACPQVCIHLCINKPRYICSIHARSQVCINKLLCCTHACPQVCSQSGINKLSVQALARRFAVTPGSALTSHLT